MSARTEPGRRAARTVFMAAMLCLLPAEAAAGNPIERLQTQLDQGEVELKFHPTRGYLDSLLEALGVSPLTQTLVFSKTSAQFRLITPQSPRAVYFNDDIYVGWVRGGPILEISTADPERGGAFYTLDQRAVAKPRFVADNGQCLQCHESARTLRVPGHLTRSVYPAPDGQPVFRLGTIDVDRRTPLDERFGGWFVTGVLGDHLGNRILPGDDPAAAQPFPLEDIRRIEDYLRPDSNVVGHLLLAHQTETHNHITRAALEARAALDYRREMTSRFGEASPELEASVKRRIEGPAEDLLEALLFADEAPLDGRIEKTAPLADAFAARGPLYRLDLDRRLLASPISYLITSDAFDSLPGATLDYLAKRLREILSGEDGSKTFAHLSADDRAAIRGLLEAEKPGLLKRGL